MEQDLEKLAYEWTTTVVDNIDRTSDYYCQTSDVFRSRSDKMLGDLLKTNNLAEEESYLISAMVGEIGNNSFDHNLGRWPDVAGIFFGCNITDDKVKIVLADRGQGVLKTLKQVKPALANDVEALQVAFTERISGRAPENRGNGLKFVRKNIKNIKMHLIFISGNAQAELNEKMKIQEQEENIKGCLAILSL
ncbi:MAG: hypothetical protein KAQ87_05085 [Candidatus Pacebacteria bacterium]|nr:hypothetical protein [Candidatus Paceibacterota bacterium]